MNRDELRREILLTLLERGGQQTPQSLARHIGGGTTPSAVRSMLLNLVRDGMVRKNDRYGGPSWEIVESEVMGRLRESLQAEFDEDDTRDK